MTFVNLLHATYLSGKSRRTLYNWMGSGHLAYREARGSRFVELESLLARVQKLHRNGRPKRRSKKNARTVGA